MTRDEQRAQCFEAMCVAYEAETGTPADWNGMMEAFDALHDIARACPIEATEGMRSAADTQSNWTAKNLWRAMSAAGDLTNGSETKP